MKGGNLLTAAAIMFALARADSGRAYEAILLQIQGGKFRHRGKGRGSISPNFLGKPERGDGLARRGARDAARRRRQVIR